MLFRSDYYALTEKNSPYLAALEQQEPDKFNEITVFRTEYKKARIIAKWEVDPSVLTGGLYTAPGGTFQFGDYQIGLVETAREYDSKILNSYFKSIGKSTVFVYNPSPKRWELQP